ncbi:MAG: M24 family metallopeptidase [Verrucomicrobiales bacterium]|nr:M24 family metallopeptidase [Verrucomicrobiales bacterium]
MKTWENHRKVQAVAKDVLMVLGQSISSRDTETSIAQRAKEMLADRGISETWYYDCPALVLLGSRSCASLSGRDYQPGNEPVGEFNLVTVDLSPSREGVWGDCARSFFVESGAPVREPATQQFQEGLRVQFELHATMKDFVSPETTFEELHRFSNDKIATAGFENLDFMANLGHSIGSSLDDRIYIEEGNSTRLSEVEFFTFEPHIRQADGSWGFKHENIYYFNEDGAAVEL